MTDNLLKKGIELKLTELGTWRNCIYIIAHRSY